MHIGIGMWLFSIRIGEIIEDILKVGKPADELLVNPLLEHDYEYPRHYQEIKSSLVVSVGNSTASPEI